VKRERWDGRSERLSRLSFHVSYSLL